MLCIRKKSGIAQSCPTLCDPMTVAHQAPLPMGFSRQGYWSGLPCPSPGDLPDPGVAPGSPAWQADSLPSEPPVKEGFALLAKVATLEQSWKDK